MEIYCAASAVTAPFLCCAYAATGRSHAFGSVRLMCVMIIEVDDDVNGCGLITYDFVVFVVVSAPIASPFSFSRLLHLTSYRMSPWPLVLCCLEGIASQRGLQYGL
jgi:hypothetical protein